MGHLSGELPSQVRLSCSHRLHGRIHTRAGDSALIIRRLNQCNAGGQCREQHELMMMLMVCRANSWGPVNTQLPFAWKQNMENLSYEIVQELLITRLVPFPTADAPLTRGC